jgi:hypothetical protein
MSNRVEKRLNLARMVVQRLARLSVDSGWARIAGGYRGGMLKMIEELEGAADPEAVSEVYLSQADFLIGKGLDVLARAAREIGDPELARFAGQTRAQFESQRSEDQLAS